MIERAVFLAGYRNSQEEVGDWLRRYLRSQGEDEVHRLRTAIRRFERSSALLPASVRKEKRLRRYRSDLRDLARLNNRIRDIDIISLKLLERGNETDVASVLARLRRERDELLLPALKLARSVRPLPTEIDSEKVVARKLRKRFRRVVGELLEDFRSDLKVVLKNPGELQALHSLRIGSKELRYTLELAPGGHSASATRRLAEWQDSLGRIRDIDILTGYLSGLDSARHLTEFVQERRDERRRLYLRFVDAARRSDLVALVDAVITG